MKAKLLIYLIFFVLINFNLSADDIEIYSDNIKILNNNNIIKSFNTKANIKEKKLFLEGNNSVYDKNKQEITLTGDVIFIDELKNLKIYSEKALYNQTTDKLTTKGITKIEIEDEYEILSKNMIYDRISQIILSRQETTISDKLGNVYNIKDSFKFNLDDDVISAKKVNILDNKNNIYFFENSKIDLVNKEIAGKEIKIEFIDSFFGNADNDPRLKGRSVISNSKETKIYKTVFTTCNTENKVCPGWELETEEFTHDKIKKTFNYRNSWLKLFDKEIFYFPFFSHPDPSVKRKSGFLPATYGSSNNYGSWINIPYYKAIDIDKDFTFKPRLYLDDKFILQSEYRQAFENSKLIADFSYNNDGKNTNSHFFTKTNGTTKKGTEYQFNYQSVSNDEYLKLHNLSNSSNIINNESLLTSEFSFRKKIDDNTSFKNNFFIYEDLSIRDSDRFRYVFPNFDFDKKINIDKNYKGNFYFNSSGYQQSYNTNSYQAVVTNDFLFNSDNFISTNGIKSNYQFLIKQDNSFTSSPTGDTDTTDLYQTILFRSELPLMKNTDKFNTYLKPIFVTRYSPNNSKNISSKDLRLSYDNIFSLNRIGSERNIEEGGSISLGIEYDINDKQNNSILNFKIANSISDKKKNNLPTKSKLNQRRSDIVGKLNFKPIQILDINYNFSYDRDLKNSNYQSISTNFNYSNFQTSFNYLSKDNEIGNTETVRNTSSYNFNKENKISFDATKNLKTDFTEYYNLTYKYQTDCLITSIKYTKKFYKDGNILPDKSLLFYLKFIPFAELRPQATVFK
tara:strand:- start:427 stop:2805 length:2379 start_codon:yes stop_codon:yes gene_type:complete